MSTLLTITLLLLLCRTTRLLLLCLRLSLDPLTLIIGLFEMTPSPPPPLSHPFPINRRKRVDHNIPLESRTMENPLVWNSSYQPPWRRSPPSQLSPPRASTQNSPSLITSTGKRHRSRSASPTRLTLSLGHKKIKYQLPSPLQVTRLPSVTSESHHPRTTLLRYKPSSTQRSTASEKRRALRLEAPSLKTTSTTLSKCSHWLAHLETPEEVPPVKMTPLPVSCPDSIKYGGPVPPHLSFVARGHQLPTASRKTPFLTLPHFLPQFSPLLLGGDDWHPNRMLPSDAAPVDSKGKEELGLAWYSLYFQYRDTFRAQLSLCLISRHDLLTRLLLSDSNVTSDVTTSRVLFPSKADDKYLQHTYVW
jgi:hypothetical protein